MGAGPGEGYIELGAGQRTPIEGGQLAAGVAHPQMAGKEQVHIVHDPALGHGQSPADPLLPRLEQQLDPAGELVQLHPGRQGHPQAYGDVAVVAAGMHDAGILGTKPLGKRPVAGGLELLEGQGVHIKPQGHRGARPPGIQNRHRAGDPLHPGQDGRAGPPSSCPGRGLPGLLGGVPPHRPAVDHLGATEDGNPGFLQHLHNPGGGPGLLPTELRMPVELPPPGG